MTAFGGKADIRQKAASVILNNGSSETEHRASKTHSQRMKISAKWLLFSARWALAFGRGRLPMQNVSVGSKSNQ